MTLTLPTLTLPKDAKRRWAIGIATVLLGFGLAGWLIHRVIRTDQRDVYKWEPTFAVASPMFERSTALMGFPMVGGNSVQILNNGAEIFPAMLKDITQAQRSVNLETFILKSDEAGMPFIKALSDAAQRGIQVRLLIDAVGSKLKNDDKEKMEKAGVRLRIYRPLMSFRLHKLSHRTHRKILVVDGRIAYAGGLGWAKEWLGDARNKNEWRETQVRVEGPAAAHAQAIFSENWTYSSGEVLAGDAFYPPLQPAGKVLAQGIKTSRGDASNVAKMMYFMAIEAARERIRITNPYFLPDAEVRKVLVNAAKRGVDVQILVPGDITDAKFVRSASWGNYGDLLKAGIKIYEYQPTMIHAKNFVADGIYSTVGSINFDARSMKFNSENSFAFYDRGIGSQLEALFEKDRVQSERVTYEKWKDRGPHKRLTELISLIWEPYY